MDSRLLTMADVAVLSTELPSGTVRYGLWKGELRVLRPPEDVHAAVVAILGGLLFTRGEHQHCGCVRVGGGVVLGHDPDTVVGADAIIPGFAVPVADLFAGLE
jgi:hypothetical protein